MTTGIRREGEWVLVSFPVSIGPDTAMRERTMRVWNPPEQRTSTKEATP